MPPDPGRELGVTRGASDPQDLVSADIEHPAAPFGVETLRIPAEHEYSPPPRGYRGQRRTLHWRARRGVGRRHVDPVGRALADEARHRRAGLGEHRDGRHGRPGVVHGHAAGAGPARTQGIERFEADATNLVLEAAE